MTARRAGIGGFKFAWLTSAVVAVLLVATGCDRSPSGRVQGYVEGEYVYVASPLAGILQTLNVERGQQVKAGDPLFELDRTAEQAARDEADRRLAQARSNLEDARKGKRPSEIESLQAELAQAKAAASLSEQNLERMERLAPTGAASQEDLDRARSTREQERHHVIQLEADLKTAALGQREDAVMMAEDEVRAREAMLVRADWDLSQKRQAAPQAGLVFDTLYRQGEWVAAGRPVVVLLPPPNVKVRAFVPEAMVGSIQPGDAVHVIVDGVNQRIEGKVTYISPQAEYTPPVIFSQESRSKLMFMVEAHFDAATSAKLHPGQPVDVEFVSH